MTVLKMLVGIRTLEGKDGNDSYKVDAGDGK